MLDRFDVRFPAASGRPVAPSRTSELCQKETFLLVRLIAAAHSAHMRLLRTISEAWAWTGIEPCRVVDQNAFGNLLVEDQQGRYWRICPEELSCSVVADNAHQFQQLRAEQEFQRDWEMARLTAHARAKLGEPGDSSCFCLKTPAVLGGKYTIANIGQIHLEELISFSGDVARQMKDLPDGTQIKLKFAD